MKLSAHLLFILAIVGGSCASPKGDELKFDDYDYCLCPHCDFVAINWSCPKLYYDRGLIREKDSAYCLQVYVGGQFGGSDYTVYGGRNCDQDDRDQQFALLPVDKRFVLVQHLDTGLCLDIWKNDPYDEKEVNLLPCEDIADQRFHRPKGKRFFDLE